MATEKRAEHTAGEYYMERQSAVALYDIYVNVDNAARTPIKIAENMTGKVAARIVRACNSHDELCRTLGEIATAAAYVVASTQCPKGMKPGMQAIVDVATAALDKTTA